MQYASKLGVNLPDLLISQPDTGEQALEIVDSLVRSGAVDLIVVDSVAALTQAVGDAFPQAYLPVLAKRRDTPYGERERDFQAYRRRTTTRRPCPAPRR